MPRQKKDGEKISLYLDRTTVNRLRKHAEIKGQTLTMAMERLLTKALDEEYEKNDRNS